MWHLGPFLQQASRWILATATCVLIRAQDTVPNVVISADRPLIGGLYAARLPIFFSPTAPVMGTAIGPLEVFDLRFVAPSSLGEYVGEYFYPALGTVLAENKLSEKLARRLAGYVRARDAEERELLATLEQALRMPSDRQLPALQQAAERQAQALDALENDAEVLRRELIAAGTSWNAQRDLPISRMKGPRQKEMQARLLLATAFYRDGLGPVQRDLLVEAAIEGGADPGPWMAPFLTVDRRLLFFVPGATRLGIPKQLGRDTAALVARFEELKASLRSQLADAATNFDLDTSRKADQAWKALSSKQGKGLAEVELRAEELRRDFEASGIEGWTAPDVQWPGDFAAELMRYQTARNALVAARSSVLDLTRRESLGYRPGADRKHLSITSTPLQGAAGSTYYLNQVGVYGAPAGASGAVVMERLSQALDTFDREQAPAVAALAKAEAVLGPWAAKLMRVEGSMTSPQALAFALKATEQAARAREYSEYQVATLKPGLAPAQRRLLLKYGLRRLRLPLPGGELQVRE